MSTIDMVVYIFLGTLFLMVAIAMVCCLCCDICVFDFLEETHSKVWCKHRGKKYIVNNIKRIDKLSRKGKDLQYCEIFCKVVRKSLYTPAGGESLPAVFTRPNLAKKRENCVMMIKYILGVIEKYPLLDETRERLLDEFFGVLCHKAPEFCSINGPEITFNGFKFISISLYKKPYKVIAFDANTGEEHQLNSGDHLDSIDLTLLVQTLLRKRSLPIEAIEPPKADYYSG